MNVGPPLPKQTAEIWPWSVDFKSELEASETITEAIFRAVKKSDGSDATTALRQANRTISGSIVAQELKAGTHGEDYWLELKITTNLGRTFEAERELIVRDIPTPVS